MDQQHPLRTIISVADFARVERLAVESGDQIDVVATRLGLCSEAQMLCAFAEAAGVSIAPSASFPETPILKDRVNPAFWRKIRAVPLSEDYVLISTEI
jgi:hypothetical protein